MSANYGHLAHELRDGVLQDLVAIGLLIEAARAALNTGASTEEVEALLDRAQLAAQGDMAALRSMIDRLRPAA